MPIELMCRVRKKLVAVMTIMSQSWSHDNHSQEKYTSRPGHSHHSSQSHNRSCDLHTVTKDRRNRNRNRDRSHKTSSHNRSRDRRPENSIAVTIAIAMRESRSQSRSRKFVTFRKHPFGVINATRNS